MSQLQPEDEIVVVAEDFAMSFPAFSQHFLQRGSCLLVDDQ
jgi:hypothetical protein